MSLAKHTSYNLLGAAVPIAVAIITVPLYLTTIGLDRYGILSICWLLVGYFGLFDFGIGKAVAQRIATLEKASAERRSAIFWTGALLTAFLSIVALILFVPFVTWGLALMDVPSKAILAEIQQTTLLLVIAVPMGIAQSLLVGALTGRARFGLVNIITGIGTVATAVVPLAIAHWVGPQLWNLLAASLTVRAVLLIVLAAACRTAVPVQRPTLSPPADRTSLLKFGGWATVTSIVGPMLVYFDRFAIGATLGTAAIALYVVPFQLVGYLVLVPDALARALFPRLASSSTSDSARLAEESLTITAFASTVMAMGAALVIHPFFTLWIGPDAAKTSVPIAYVLLFGVWANSIAQIPFVRLQAMGRPDLAAKAHVAELLPYVALLYAGMSQFGLIGAALAWSARCLLDVLLLTTFAKLAPMRSRRLIAYFGLMVVAIAALWLFDSTVAWQWIGLIILYAAAALFLFRKAPTPIITEGKRLISAWKFKAQTR